jgi:hypothetical protein
MEGVEIIGLDHVQVAAPAGGEEDARRFHGGPLTPPTHGATGSS